MSAPASLAVLADATRRAIFERVTATPCSVNEVARTLAVSLSAVSQHLKLLREAGLVVEERRGRLRIYSARPEALDALAAYIDGLRNAAPAGADKADMGDSLDRQAAREDILDWPGIDPTIILASFRIRLIARLMEKALERTASRLGLHGGELLVLDALRRHGPPYETTPTALGKATWITLAGLGKRLDRLEAGGHVERRPHPTDRRGSLVRLTARGNRALERGLRIGTTTPDFMALAEMTDHDRGQLVGLLRRLQHRIEHFQAGGKT